MGVLGMSSAKELRQRARESLQGKWASAIGAGLLWPSIFIAFLTAIAVASVIGAVVISQSNGDTDSILSMTQIVGRLSYLFYGAMLLGLTVYFLRFVRQENPGIDDVFTYVQSMKSFLKSIGYAFLTSLYNVLWFLLLIIPGIIKNYSYRLTPYLLVDHPDLSVNQAITKSRELMDGRKWKLFVLDLSFFGWTLLSLLTLGIGFIWLIPYYCAATTHFYEDVRRAREDETEVEVV